MASLPSSAVTTTGRRANPVGGQDGHLGLVDNRELHHRAPLAGVGDGECAPRDLIGVQLLGPSPPRQVGHLLSDRYQPLAVGVDHHRGQQPLEVEVDRDGQVDVVVDHQLAVAHGCVDVGIGVEGVAHRPSDERQIGEAEAVLGLERLPVSPTHVLYALEVHLRRGQHMGRHRLGPNHVLTGDSADVAERDNRVPSGCSRRGRWRRRGRGAG